MHKTSDMPTKALGGSEKSYEKVLYTMRNQEMLFYSNSMRSGY